MKNISFLLLLLLVFCYGCKKNDSNPVTSDPPKSLVVEAISGQLDGWVYGKSYIAQFDRFGYSAIDENGKFTITNLSNPADNQLKSIVNYFDSSKTQPVISDNSAKFYIVSSITLAKSKSPSQIIGFIQNSGGDHSSGYYYTSYIYLDKAVTINGTASYVYENGTRETKQNFIFNNLSFEKGWNKLVTQITGYDWPTNTSTAQILRKEPSTGIWSYPPPISIVTIAAATKHAGLKYPLCIDNGYKRSAALYTASELQTSGVITKIGWKALTKRGDNRPVKIYLKEVAESTLDAASSTSLIEGATKVFDAPVSLLLDSWNWNEYTLLETFPYSGTQNLLVIVETSYGGSGIGAADDCYFEYSILDECHFLTWSNNNSSEMGLGTASLDRPNIRFTIEPL
ncbi:MAG: hypothetical protein ACM3RX_10340 [Methanococcaceae archaeon]